jgi:hypothetical protein
MKFEIENPGGSILTLVRKAGYHALRDSFVRPLGTSGYPRFHLYIEQKGNYLVFSLHLDQKKPIYKGTTAHSGEYDSDIVRKESERIKQTL